MKYQCQVMIKASLEKVFTLFIENMVMNKNITPGSKCSFTCDIDENNKIYMTETIESINAPFEIVTIYEVDKVWNRCVNQFVLQDNKVVFTIFTEFVFEDESEVNEVNFRNKTQSQMEKFKKLVESKG